MLNVVQSDQVNHEFFKRSEKRVSSQTRFKRRRLIAFYPSESFLFAALGVVSLDAFLDDIDAGSHVLSLENVSDTDVGLSYALCSVESACRSEHNGLAVNVELRKQEHEELLSVVYRKLACDVECSLRYAVLDAFDLVESLNGYVSSVLILFLDIVEV